MDKTVFDLGRSLYLVLSGEYGRGRPPLAIAREAARGGINLLQMREKKWPRQELLALGADLSSLCRAHGICFIVNDDPYLAKDLDADGVHLGQEDAARHPIDGVRRILGPEKIIGVSTHSLAQFRQAQSWCTDYTAFGPLYPTRTKDYHIGIGEMESVLAEATKPVVMIGGINRINVGDLLRRGVRHVALIRDIMEAGDVAGRVRWYRERLAGEEARGGSL